MIASRPLIHGCANKQHRGLPVARGTVTPRMSRKVVVRAEAGNEGQEYGLVSDVMLSHACSVLCQTSCQLHACAQVVARCAPLVAQAALRQCNALSNH
jgi:hypothetical protein